MCNTQPYRPAWVKTDEKFNTFICPKCGYPQYCGCSSCKDKIPKNYFPYKWRHETIEGQEKYPLELCVCANCGFEASIDWWMEYCAKQYMDKPIT